MCVPGERRLILIRHSAPVLDPEVPAREWHLSQEGQLRCSTLAEYLAPYGLDVVVTSVETKAIETGQILARRLGIPCMTAEGLHEHDRSNETGLDRAQFYEAIARLFACPDERVYGTESAAQARGRFAKSLEEVLARYPDANVAVVTHGTVLSLYVAARAGLDAHALWRRLGLPCYAILSRPDLRLLEMVDQVIAP
jgi:broad specificity phosphatase PhoE